MANYDSADLLSRFEMHSGRPSSDASLSTAQKYQYLSDAQLEVARILMVHAPHAMMTAPALMTTADSGATYTFAGGITPLGAVQIYDALNGRLLRPCTNWDSSGDYVWEGSKIRIPKGGTRTFASGPYARYVTAPTVLDGSTAPTLTPDNARILIVYKALEMWASGRGQRDPAPFEKMFAKAAWGDPKVPGDIGIIGALKVNNDFLGATAYQGSESLVSFETLSTVNGYTAI